MKYFFDTEFNDTGTEFQLISIGIVSDDGREYYAQNPLFRWDAADPAKYWLRQNVWPGLKQCSSEQGPAAHLRGKCLQIDCPWRRPEQMAGEIADFTDHATLKPTRKYDPPEFWGFFVAWDWIILLRLYGRVLFDHPAFWPDRANDIAQLAQMLGKPIQRGKEYTHNALDDAKWTKQEYERLTQEL